MERTTLRPLLFYAAFFIAGCQTPQQWVDRQVGSGQPQEYKDGYLDGCPSGNSAAGYIYAKFKKDVMRYSDDSIYRQGWDDGFNICKSKHESLKRDVYGR